MKHRMPYPAWVALTMLTCVGLNAGAWGQVTNFTSRTRQIKVANLLVSSARYDNARPPGPTNLENPDPHVWYILDQSPLKPAHWDFVNPLAPPVVTQDIIDRWQVRGDPWVGSLQLGQPITKNMGPYWEVVLNEANLPELARFDMLLIANHRMTAFTDSDRRMLRQLVDAGGQVWIDDCWGLRVGRATDRGGVLSANYGVATNPDANDPAAVDPADPIFTNRDPVLTPFASEGFFAPLQFDHEGATGRAIIPDRLHPLMSYPFWMGLFEANNLGDKYIGSYRISPYDGTALFPVILNSAYSDATANPPYGGGYVAAGRYGAGTVIAVAGDVSCKLNDAVTGGRSYDTASGINSGIYCGDDLSNLSMSRYRGDQYFIFNAVNWADEWGAASQNARRTSAARETISERLDLITEHAETIGAAVNPTTTGPIQAPSPVLASGAVFCVFPHPSGNGDVLVALDADPARDMDGDLNPDDGAKWADLQAAGYTNLAFPELDALWVWRVQDGVSCPVTVTHVALTSGTTATHADVVLVGTKRGELGALTALPRDANGIITPSSADGVTGLEFPGWGGNNPINLASLPPAGLGNVGWVTGITVARGVAYVTTAGTDSSDGALFVVNVPDGGPTRAGQAHLPADDDDTVVTNLTSPAVVGIVPDPNNGTAMDETVYVFGATQTGNTATSVGVLRAHVMRVWDERLRVIEDWTPPAATRGNLYLMRGYRRAGFQGGFCALDPNLAFTVRFNDVPVPGPGASTNDWQFVFTDGTIGPTAPAGQHVIGVFVADAANRPANYPAALNWPPEAGDKVSIDYYTEFIRPSGGGNPMEIGTEKWIYNGLPGTGFMLTDPPSPGSGPALSPENVIVLPLARDPASPADGMVLAMRDQGFPASGVVGGSGPLVFDPTTTWDATRGVDRVMYRFRIPYAGWDPEDSPVGVTGFPACGEGAAVVSFTAEYPPGSGDTIGGAVALELDVNDLAVPLGSPTGFRTNTALTVDAGDPVAPPSGPLRGSWPVRVFDALNGTEILAMGGANWSVDTKRNAIRFSELHAGRRVLIQWIDTTTEDDPTPAGTDMWRVYQGYFQVPRIVRWQYPALTKRASGPITRPSYSGGQIADADDVDDPLEFDTNDADNNPGIVPFDIDFETGIVSFTIDALGASDTTSGIPGDIEPVRDADMDGVSADPSPDYVVSAIGSPTISSDKAIVPVTYSHAPDPLTNTRSEALLVFAMDPRDSVYYDEANEPWPGASVPWDTTLSPPWPSYRYIDDGEANGWVSYWTNQVGALGQPHNPSYDLLSVVNGLTSGEGIASTQAVVGRGRIYTVSVAPRAAAANQWNWFYRVYEAGTSGLVIGDLNRVLSVDAAGSPSWEVASARYLYVSDPTGNAADIVSLPVRISRPQSVLALDYAGKPNNYLVADSGNDRVIELRKDGVADWMLQNRWDPNHLGSGQGAEAAFRDTPDYAPPDGGPAYPNLPPGASHQIREPHDAYRWAWYDYSGPEPVLREWTFVADTGNFRIIAVEQLTNEDGDRLPPLDESGGEAIYAYDQTQAVIDPTAAGEEVLPVDLDGDGTPDTGAQGQLKTAGKYEFITVKPLMNPGLFGGPDNPMGFSGVLAAVANYALSTSPIVQPVDVGGQNRTPDPPDPNVPASYDGPHGFPHPYPRELGPGASVVKIGRADPEAADGSMPDGRIDWAFSTIYRWDQASGTLAPYGKLDRIYHIQGRLDPGYMGTDQAAYFIEICASLSRMDGPVPIKEDGLYPVTYFPAVGPETGTYSMTAAGTNVEGYAILGLPPGSLGGPADLAHGGLSLNQWGVDATLAAGDPVYYPWRFTGEQYAVALRELYAQDNGLLPYTGRPASPYAAFRAVHVEYQPGGGYLIVNGHEDKGEVLVVVPPSVNAATPTNRLRLILPRPEKYGTTNAAAQLWAARDQVDLWPPAPGSAASDRSADERRKRPWIGPAAVEGRPATYRLTQPLAATTGSHY